MFDGKRDGVWSVAICGDRGWWMSWLMEMEEMEEMEEVFCGVGMVDVVFPHRKIWSLVLGDWEKMRGQWWPLCDVIRQFQLPWSEFDCDFVSIGLGDVCGRYGESFWLGVAGSVHSY